MKKMKKLVALLIAAVMVMGMAVTTMAANADLTGHTFTAYQIFNATTISNTTNELGNITWGDGISADGQTALMAKYNVESAPALAKKIAGFTEAQAKEFAQEAYKYTTGDGTAVVSGTTALPIGYYLVKDTTEGNVKVYNLSVLKVADNETPVTITSKVDVPKVEKKILEAGKDEDGKDITVPVDVNEASIGDTVNYQWTGTLPSDLADYETYFYRFNDTLSKGLTFNNDVVVKVDGKDVTQYFYVGATEYSATAGTTITVSIKDLLALNNLDAFKENKINASSTVVVTYSARLNEKAVIAGEGNPNDVDLDYSNNPDDSGTPSKNPPTPPGDNPPTPEHPHGTTPKDKVKTFTTELTILKTDQNNQILTGAEFTLTGNGVNVVLVTEEKFVVDENGEYWKLTDGTYTTTPPTIAEDETDNTDDYDSIDTKYALTKVVTEKGKEKSETVVKGMVAADGTVTFTGLGDGTYTITESVVPDGYNAITPIEFTIGHTTNEEALTCTFTSSIPNVVIVGDDNKLDTTIINRNGATLPETGGMGTKLFYIFGSMMVLCAGVLLITKRRMAAK